MVNADLNWASIVGIVLAVCGGGLYFLRSFKPALSRDYDVFFAAIGLLCGGILIIQGWRLDPILTLAQFLLAGTTVFFGYESVRLRGITTDQAKRSAFFDDEQIPENPRNLGRNRWDDDYDQFESSERPSRRFKSREFDSEDQYQDDRFAERRLSRTIPESAASRRRTNLRDDSKFNDLDTGRSRRFQRPKEEDKRRSNFGERRRPDRNEVKKGSRPLASKTTSRVPDIDDLNKTTSETRSPQRNRSNIRSQSNKNKVEDASFTQKNTETKRVGQKRRSSADLKANSKNQSGRYSVGSKRDRPRDNSSRFDD